MDEIIVHIAVITDIMYLLQ